jgi:hypothetical protein
VLTWQFSDGSSADERPLHAHTAGPDGVFGGDQEMSEPRVLADLGLAVSPAGEVVVAEPHRPASGRGSSLRVMQAPAGLPLAVSAALSTGGAA